MSTDKIDHKVRRAVIRFRLLYSFTQPKDFSECPWIATRRFVGLLRERSLKLGDRTPPPWPLDDHLLFEGFADENVDILGSFWSALWISGLALAKLSVPRGFSEADLVGIISHKPPPQTACLIRHVPRSCRCIAANVGSLCPRREG